MSNMERDIQDIKTVLSFLLRREINSQLTEAEKLILKQAMKRLELLNN